LRFEDADGDMVADTPSDPGKQIDPSTLIFAYTPVEDPAVYAKVWKGFLEHMEKVTGKKIQFFPVQSNAAQIEAMRARPSEVSTSITAITAPLDQYSFPSGHTMHAVAFSIIATGHHPELALVLVPFSSLIALSRMVLGLHYPTDVIAGGMIGGYVASILMRS
jgi:PAP2 superfamily/ABC transporter, phosphonate, periplasmic substrate-binding protein